MTYRRKRSKNFGRVRWTSRDMDELAQAQVSALVVRTFQQGKGIDGRKFKKYSTTPMSVSKRFARLAPKGGRRSRTGKSVYYEGGYRQYKKESRTGGVKSGRSPANAVDLTLSGQMMRSFKVLRHNSRRATIGLTGHARIYGAYVNKSRPWIGLSRNDRKYLKRVFRRMLKDKLRGRRA